jgi:hypothetical protein
MSVVNVVLNLIPVAHAVVVLLCLGLCFAFAEVIIHLGLGFWRVVQWLTR